MCAAPTPSRGGRLLCRLACLVAAVGAAQPRAVDLEWRELEPGLEYARLPVVSGPSSGSVNLVRVDSRRFRFRLLNASAPGEGESRTAREWSARHGLTAVINAAMYQADRKTSVSFMRTPTHVNNGRVSKDRAILAFDPTVPGVPEVQILDRDCQDFDEWRHRYGSFVQSIRMVSCDGRNVWSPETRRSSVACLGIDKEARVILVHARMLVSPHDLIARLLDAPLQLRSALYLEGGPEAQLFVRAGGREMEFVGQAGLGILPEEPRPAAWRIPNVLGIERRRRSP